MPKKRRGSRTKGRKRLILSLFAALSGVLSWQHIEGLGLGDRATARRPKAERPHQD